MPSFNVDAVIVDADFADEITLIRRAQVIDAQTGRTTLSETQSQIRAVVQNVNDTKVIREMGSTRVEDMLTVHSREILSPDRDGSGYADIIVWLGDRYEVVNVAKSFENFGIGWSATICVRVSPTNV